MAFTKEEKAVIQHGIDSGRTQEEQFAAVQKYRKANPQVASKQVAQPPTFGATLKQVGGQIAEKARFTGADFKETLGDVKETGQAIAGQFMDASDRLGQDFYDPNATILDKIVATGREGFRFGSRAFGDTVVGVGKAMLPQETEDKFKAGVEDAVISVVDTAAENKQVMEAVTFVKNKWDALPPEQKKMFDNISGYAEGLGELALPGIYGKVKKQVLKVFGKFFTKVDDVLPPPGATPLPLKTATPNVLEVPPAKVPPVSTLPIQTPGLQSTLPQAPVAVEGAIQTGKDVLGRIPRAIDNLKESAQEAAIRAERIRQSSPTVAEAIKVNVPDKTINLVSGADAPTVTDMRKMQQLAAEAGEVRPTKVAGESAANQYSLINNKRKVVGSQLGDAIKALPDADVNMTNSFNKLDDILNANRITKNADGSLNFDATRYTPEQGTAIQKLYTLARRGADDTGLMDANLIHAKDSLFSTLRRQDTTDKLPNIRLDVDGEDIPIYSIFRDIYSTQLDTLSPDIRALNKEYALYRQFVDDMDNTIFKQAKLNTKLDPSDSAAINLRRIESNALSQPAFQKVIDEMAVLSKMLGYEGSDPASLLRFGLELEKLYPDIIPGASFSGGIRTGVIDLANKFLDTGKPGMKDQQRAIQNMLEELDETFTVPDNQLYKADNIKKNNTIPKNVDIPDIVPQTPIKSIKFIPDRATKKTLVQTIKDTPNQQGGFIKVGDKTIKEIDILTKNEISEIVEYLNKGIDVKFDATFDYDKVLESSIDKLASKYGINLNTTNTQLAKRFQAILDKTKTGHAVNPKNVK